MLRLVLGRNDADRAAAIYQRVAQREEGTKKYLIVPDQASHEAERALCAAGGDQVSTWAEVLSLSRLAGRVFAHAGGAAAPVLDQGGRVLLLAAALKEVSASLRVYAKPSGKTAFLENMLETIDELKYCCITPEVLAQAGEENEKLQDLSLIYGAYDLLTEKTAADPRDKLVRLVQALEQSRWAEGKQFYFLGFSDFNLQERRVIGALLEDARQVTCELLCDSLDGEDTLFETGRKAAHQLLQLAKQAGQPSEVEWLRVPRELPGELVCLEREVFSQTPVPWEREPEHVELFCAQSARAEVEWAAARLRRLAMEEGIRFRDMVVTARDLEGYRALVETIFPQYDLPVFTSAMTDILEKPVLAVVSSAFDVLENGWAREDVLRYLKTGLAGLENDQVDRLENYAEIWDIRGSKWLGPWHWRPDGQFGACEEEAPELEQLNELREKVVQPLLAWKRRGGTTGRDQAKSLFDLLEDIRLPEHLTQKVELLTQKGLLQRAEEYRQLWDILCDALDQCAVILKDVPVDRGGFGQLLKLVLSQYDVGTIPVSLDRVTVSELPRISGKRCRVLCLLGADDASIPQVPASKGLLSDEDRDMLVSKGLELMPKVADKLSREWTILYEGCTCPDKRLMVFYPARGTMGEERRPSVLVSRLKAVFPRLQTHWEGEEDYRLIAPLPALQSGEERVWPVLKQLPGYAERVERIERARELTRGALSPAAVDVLYGKRIPMSASRLDKYRSCHFSYFMQYGLQAKARKKAGFSAPEYGTFIHYVLEHVLKAGGDRLPAEERKALVDQVVERYVQEELGGMEHQSARFRYLFRRLRKTVLAVVENAAQELSRSDFRPVAFELGFARDGDLPPVTFEAGGVTVSLSGFVDRVDGWEKDGRLYLRVVDYKTGRKSFDWSDVFHGMGLQMLVYLATLEKQGGPLFGKEIVPAGVLYLPARDAVVSGSPDMSEKEIRAMVDKQLCRKGIVLDDPEVIDAMEHTDGDGYRYLPLKVSGKTGAISGEALVSAEKLGRLHRHVEQVLEELASEMAWGTITADPFWRGAQKNACIYCEYAAACQFREGVGGDRRRVMKSMKQAQFWAQIEEKEERERGLSADS